MGSFYTGNQALWIAVFFAGLDVAVNVFGLAWNGRYFTLDNLKHWFDLANYSFLVNPVDFLVWERDVSLTEKFRELPCSETLF